MNYPAYFKQKRAEAACFRTGEHPDYYNDKGGDEEDGIEPGYDGILGEG